MIWGRRLNFFLPVTGRKPDIGYTFPVLLLLVVVDFCQDFRVSSVLR